MMNLFCLFQDGIYMDEVIEITVGAMHLMAKDMSSRLKMKQLNCIPIFVQVYMITRDGLIYTVTLLFPCSYFIRLGRTSHGLQLGFSASSHKMPKVLLS